MIGKIFIEDDTLNALVVAKGNMLKGWKGKRTMGKFRSQLLSHLYQRDFASFTFEFGCEMFFMQTATQIKNSSKEG